MSSRLSSSSAKIMYTSLSRKLAHCVGPHVWLLLAYRLPVERIDRTGTHELLPLDEMPFRASRDVCAVAAAYCHPHP